MRLPLSGSLSLPANAVTQKMAAIGRTGSGKTYMVGKLVESMLDAEIQVVILDPVGVWYGLRLLADGKSPGYPIPVFGGLKGDIPLEPTGGSLVADLIVDRGISIVLDVSQFESDADKARFATDFATRFYFRKKAAPSAVHLIIEEAQEFIPQNPMKGEERMLHAFQRMWKLGRNFGIGGTLVSQRPQEVSKKALNQTEALFAFQMTGPQERKAIELWMSEKGIDLGIADDLPSLKVGQCHVWSPQWLQVSEKIHIGTKKTFNSSSTPGSVGATRKQELAPIDLANLTEKMKETIERAKADDPKALRAEIARLKKEAVKAPAVSLPTVAKPSAASERRVKHLTQLLHEAMKIIATINAVNFRDTALTPEQIEQALKVAATQIGKQMEQKLKESGHALTALQKEAQKLAEKIKRLTSEDMEVSVSIAHNEPFTALPVKQHPSHLIANADGLDNGMQRIINVIAMLGIRGIAPNRESVARWLDLHPNGGSYNTHLSSLRANGYMNGFELTSLGESAVRPLPTGFEACKMPLDGSQGRILDVLHGANGTRFDRNTLAAELGLHPNGGSYNTNLSRLRTMQLIPERGDIYLLETAER